ncbi:MAG: YiiX/YebB-like N1pC/P60 family cysteine hydrolase, partial [bacterium]
CDSLNSQIARGFLRLDSLIATIQSTPLDPSAATLTELEAAFFEMSVLIAACPSRLQEYLTAFGQIRLAIKEQSQHWDLGSPAALNRLYRLLYGGRTAVEEAMLQSPDKSFTDAIVECNEPSPTPTATFFGVEVHSGDILVSRGGAPTSALIARGSDYPGNFSHSALVHIDSATNAVSIIEAHIERGVVISTVDDYLNDTKLRIMLLRLRADLPEMKAHPLLPHRAATYALQQAATTHTPYDFAMDTKDHAQLFCSEVVSAAYEQAGIDLWRKESNISEPGLRSWLAAFGVRNFTTEEPSDLEYDPQLRVVAEWRDFETLRQDHLDNAVVDVMLEGAQRGDQLEYVWYMLPLARALKLYSSLLNQFGAIGPIPEGMNATAALQNQWFGRQHRRAKAELVKEVEKFERENGYAPPYWELVNLARVAYSR